MTQYVDLLAPPLAGLWCPYPDCQFFSKNKFAFGRHLNEEHIKCEQFSCPSCHCKFVTFTAATDHMSQAHPVRPGTSSVRESSAVLTVDISDTQLPFLTVIHSGGEVDLYLEGGKVISRERPA